MTREGSKILLARDALMMGEASGRTILDGDATLHIIDQIYDYFESRTCESCTHCDKSTLTELKQAYCNKLQTGISDYDKFYCSEFKEG